VAILLELIFQGFLEWGYGLTLECWQYYSSELLDIMSLDFAYLEAHVPIIPDIMQVMLAVGWALLMGNLVFQAVKSMASGLGFEGEDPKLLFARTFVFAFLLLASPQICELGLELTSRVMEALEIPDAVHVTLVDESAFGGLTAAWLLVIICGIVIMFKVFKLILEIAERYVILAMLTIMAPLAFATGGSKSTSAIFTGWCRMFGSMCLLMATNVVFFKMLLSVLSTVPSGLDVLPWMVLIMMIVKVAKKADAIVTRIGLNPAITGDSFGGRGLPGMLAYTVVRTMTAQAVRTIGQAAKSPGRGAEPPSNGGGGFGRNGPFDRRGGPGAAGTAGQQRAVGQSSPQEESRQGRAPVFGGQQAGSEPSSGGAAVTAVRFAPENDRQGRKSAVPPGTRRAPSHVEPVQGRRAAGIPIPGKPGEHPPASSGIRTLGGMTAGLTGPGSAGTAFGRAEAKSSGMVQAAMAGKHMGPASVHVAQMSQQGPKGTAQDGSAQPAKQGITSQKYEPSAIGDTPRRAVPQTQSGRIETRFTRRKKAAPGAQSGSAASATGQRQTPPAVRQPGVAGSEGGPAAAQPSRESKRSEKELSVSGEKPLIQRQSSPARQGPRTGSGAAPPPVGSSGLQMRSGTAGTAAVGQQAAQTRHTAQTPPVKAASPEVTRRIVSAAVEKGHLIPKGPASPDGKTGRERMTRRPGKNGGDKHGKSRP